LIADDVGLGKTIEAGMTALELIIRHRARRVLIVCPSALQIQWSQQMRDKFGLDFRIVDWGCGRGKLVLWLRESGYEAADSPQRPPPNVRLWRWRAGLRHFDFCFGVFCGHELIAHRIGRYNSGSSRIDLRQIRPSIRT
jgi:hypothetical protein